MTKKVMFYVQHLLGIGHLARASLICNALVAAGFQVKMVMGGTPVPGFPGDQIDVLQLPQLKAGCMNFNELTDEFGTIVDRSYLEMREEKLISAFDEFQPDVLVIEAFPFGRRAMRFELLPLLERAKSASWNPLIVGSVRDIVQEKSRVDRIKETVDTLNKSFNVLMVHGDPNFTTLDQSFPMASDIEIPVFHTGIVSARAGELEGEVFDVVVSAGGGAAGMEIMQTGLDAMGRTNLAAARWCFLTGQNLPKTDYETLIRQKPENATIIPHRTDFRALLARARLSVSQAGYNTVADVLLAGCAAVFVPFAKGGQTEQTLRAKKLDDAGVGQMLLEENLNAGSLVDAINAAIDPGSKNVLLQLDLNGAQKTAQILRKMLA